MYMYIYVYVCIHRIMRGYRANPICPALRAYGGYEEIMEATCDGNF